MKNVSSTMNMTGFASRETGFSLTNESRSVLVDVRLLRKRGEVRRVGFEDISSEPVYAFLEEVENRHHCEEETEGDSKEQKYASNEDDGEGDTVWPTTEVSGTL